SVPSKNESQLSRSCAGAATSAAWCSRTTRRATSTGSTRLPCRCCRTGTTRTSTVTCCPRCVKLASPTTRSTRCWSAIRGGISKARDSGKQPVSIVEHYPSSRHLSRPRHDDPRQVLETATTRCADLCAPQSEVVGRLRAHGTCRPDQCSAAATTGPAALPSVQPLTTQLPEARAVCQGSRDKR